MNIQQLQLELERDEGIVYKIYNDHLGHPTFGIGHLITESDPEYGLAVGTSVSAERCTEVFEKDVKSVFADCEKLYKAGSSRWSSDFYELPEEAQLIIANMMFNMGRTRLSKFKGMKSGVDARDWERAADEMVDSRWYNQVTSRADRLVVRMRNIE